MGVDYSSKVVLGFYEEKEYKKLPKKLRDELEDEPEVYEGEFKDCQLYQDNYDQEYDFTAFGLQLSDTEYDPKFIDDKETPKITKIKKAFDKYGIKYGIIHFVEQW